MLATRPSPRRSPRAVPAATGSAASAPRPARFYSSQRWCSDRSIGWLMKRAMQSILLQADRRLAEHGLTHAQWLPLFKLRQSGLGTVNDLAREQQADASLMTRVLDRLETKKLVRRERSSEDRRVVHIALTERGQQVADAVPAVLADVMNAHLAGFSKAEWETLIDLLNRMVANGESLR